MSLLSFDESTTGLDIVVARDGVATCRFVNAKRRNPLTKVALATLLYATKIVPNSIKTYFHFGVGIENK